mmetsp:Transcript_24519/g.60599  ORF Transcript_24519/g.60599 Transcript_24519/m.60599 type:complete len:343 (-) Transcript_24519:31-1059(-)
MVCNVVYVSVGWLEDTRGKVDLIRAVWEQLRLQTQGATIGIHLAALANQRTVEEISRVELDARLVGVDLHHTTAHRRPQRGHATGRRHQAASQAEIVVIPESILELVVRVASVNAVADGCGGAEVEVGALDRPYGAQWDGHLIDGREAARLDLQLVLQYRALAVALEVEIRVIGQVDHRLGLGRRLDVEPQTVWFQPICGSDGELARKALLTVGTDILEPQLSVGCIEHAPEFLIEALRPAVQHVGRVVLGDFDGAAVKGEGCVTDAVGIPTNNATKVWTLGLVVICTVKSAHDVTVVSVFVFGPDSYDCGSIVCDAHGLYLRTGRILQHEQLCRAMAAASK